MRMGGKVIELIGQPIEYEREAEFEQIKRGVEGSFLERTKNAINEKRVYCLKNGLSLDQANYIITKALQALASLVPLKNEGKDLYELELPQGMGTAKTFTKVADYPPKDDDIPEDAFSM